MPTPFRTSRRVEFADTDMAGIVHFANFFRYMEAAEVDFLQARGLSVRLDWEGQAIGFPRVSASCDYLRPATFMDTLEISVRGPAPAVTRAIQFTPRAAVPRSRVVHRNPPEKTASTSMRTTPSAEALL